VLVDLPLRRTFACPRCHKPVRLVELTTGGMILIDEDPSPDGNIIPWPADRVSAAAQARVMDPPILSDTRWARHPCPIE